MTTAVIRSFISHTIFHYLLKLLYFSLLSFRPSSSLISQYGDIYQKHFPFCSLACSLSLTRARAHTHTHTHTHTQTHKHTNCLGVVYPLINTPETIDYSLSKLLPWYPINKPENVRNVISRWNWQISSKIECWSQTHTTSRKQTNSKSKVLLLRLQLTPEIFPRRIKKKLWIRCPNFRSELR
jgi:hypothetical protein